MSSTPTCAHLHVHSEYSLLDGACKIDGLAARAAELGQPALALTDHGVMNGAVDLFKACAKHNVKPIVGCEVYLVEDRNQLGQGKIERNHLTLLASSDVGYRNLVKLSSAGFLEGLHRGKPNVDMELISQYSQGVIALTGCLQSRLCRRILEGRPEEAKAHADDLIQALGAEQVYFEIQKNGLTEQDQANEGVIKLASEFGRPLVATADVHYLRREDYDNHSALLCVQTKSTLAEPKLSFDTNEFYLKSNEEMAKDFQEWPESLATTLEIAERCEIDIPLGSHLLPSYPTPEGKSESEYLRELVNQGLRERYGDPIPAKARERADMELGVIDQMGFSAYFLIVWDFIKYAKDNGISVGPGRGSAAGAIVAFALQITDVDPLKYDLLFERFLNPERVSMPDIDIDFSERGREQVIRYVTEKYGRERVAQIITFGRMFPRAATRDAARVLGHEYAAGDRLAKLIPDPIMGRAPSFEDCLKPSEPLKEAYDSDPTARQIVDTARGLEGIVRNSSIHAAAVVIADRPLTDIVPLQLADAGTGEDGEKLYRTVTQYSMKPIEEIGLLKMDFLGLRNLDVIENALRIIERSTGKRPDIDKIPLDDQRSYEMLSRGESVGVFQFESEGMREALKKVKPTEFEDLVALVALYRPGAMDQIPNYARGKRDPSSIQYADERLKPIVEETKGVILYQEQAMQIAKVIAGFSGAKADDLRKAIGKKNREAMAQLKPEFVEGCKASGTSAEVIEQLWTTNEKSADYSFNKSHAACYALISYRTAYLKANYPAEYMAALISSVMSTKDKVPFYVSRCDEMGIEILPPDVNVSDHEFVVVEGNIRFGLDAIKGVGFQAVEAIKRAREDGPFQSIWDFCERVDLRAVNKKTIDSLIKCGAFDSTGVSRKGALAVLDQAQSAGQKIQQDAAIGQGSIFDLADVGDGTEKATPRHTYPPIPAEEFEQSELLRLEKEAIGLFVSAHPLKEVKDALREKVDCSLMAVHNKRDGENVCVGGMVAEARKIKTKRGDFMMFAQLADLEGAVELVVFGRSLEACEEALAGDSVVVVKGRVDHKDKTKTAVVVQEVTRFQPSEKEVQAARERAEAKPPPEQQTPETTFTLTVPLEVLDRALIDDVKHIISNYPGDTEVVLQFSGEGQDRAIKLGREFCVSPTPSLRADMQALVNEEKLEVAA